MSNDNSSQADPCEGCWRPTFWDRAQTFFSVTYYVAGTVAFAAVALYMHPVFVAAWNSIFN